jgi:Transposase zinc-binding domain
VDIRPSRINSCRNRHCPKCQGNARSKWLAARPAELLPVSYFHVVFTPPHELSALVLQNKRLLYDLLFRSSAATLLEVARDPKHLVPILACSACCIPGDRTCSTILMCTASSQPAALHSMAPDGSLLVHVSSCPSAFSAVSSAARCSVCSGDMLIIERMTGAQLHFRSALILSQRTEAPTRQLLILLMTYSASINGQRRDALARNVRPFVDNDSRMRPLSHPASTTPYGSSTNLRFSTLACTAAKPPRDRLAPIEVP